MKHRVSIDAQIPSYFLRNHAAIATSELVRALGRDAIAPQLGGRYFQARRA